MAGRLDILKHALVFIAAIALIWLAGALPGMINGPQELAGAPPPSAGALINGLIASWPIFIAVAIVQALTFHYVKRFTTPLFLAGVFLLASAMAWRYAGMAV
jgi:hypothetical protein